MSYCVVYGCGKTSKLNSKLFFFAIPKEKSHRQTEWLKAIDREDLLLRQTIHASNRVCSRHFEPQYIKNKKLTSDAVPTLCLRQHLKKEDSSDEEAETHDSIACNNCNTIINGFRYKCVTCEDYDLCKTCEMKETHPHHYVIRIGRPLKWKMTENLISKWREFFKAEHATPQSLNEREDPFRDSSDDEPITKYAKNYDSGVDLSEDIKAKIRNEVDRVINLKVEAEVPPKKRRKVKKHDAGKKKSKDTPVGSDNVGDNFEHQNVPEVAFADVNFTDPIIKLENTIGYVAVLPDPQRQQPLFCPGMIEQPLHNLKISNTIMGAQDGVPSTSAQKSYYEFSNMPNI